MQEPNVPSDLGLLDLKTLWQLHDELELYIDYLETFGALRGVDHFRQLRIAVGEELEKRDVPESK